MSILNSDNTIDLTPPDNYDDLQRWLRRNFERTVSYADAIPATASSEGFAGQIAYDSDYIYVCISADTWKRAALSTW